MTLDVVEIETLITDARHASPARRAELAEELLRALELADVPGLLRRVRNVLEEAHAMDQYLHHCGCSVGEPEGCELAAVLERLR